MGYRRSNCPGACLTPFVALSGFLTLSALCSPPDRPALFHASNVLGVFPFRAFSSRGAVPSLDGLCLPGVFLSPFALHTRTFHAKRIETRCPHPDSLGLLLPGALTRLSSLATSKCLHRRAFTDRSRSGILLFQRSWLLALPIRACDRSRRPVPALPAATCPGACFRFRRTCARLSLSPVPNTSRGWPGLLPLAPSAEAPWVQNGDPVSPSTSTMPCRFLCRPKPAVRLAHHDSNHRATLRLNPDCRRTEARPLPVSSQLASPLTPTSASGPAPEPKLLVRVLRGCRSFRRCSGLPCPAFAPKCGDTSRFLRTTGPATSTAARHHRVQAEARSLRWVCCDRSVRRRPSASTAAPCRSTTRTAVAAVSPVSRPRPRSTSSSPSRSPSLMLCTATNPSGDVSTILLPVPRRSVARFRALAHPPVRPPRPPCPTLARGSKPVCLGGLLRSLLQATRRPVVAVWLRRSAS